jgi:putative ABC transport system permease protein
MQSLGRDLRYALRTLISNRGFTLAALLALALGIGANTAIFSVVYGVLLRPLPYRDAARIVVANVSPPDFRDLREANQVFDQMSIWASNLYNVTIERETSQVLGATVSPEFFEMLGQPIVGRAWRADEDSQPLVVISHDLWKARLGGDPGVIGQTLRLSGNVYTICGVMPPEFQYPTFDFKLWTTFGLAMSMAPGQSRNRQFRIFRAVAHLKPGITFDQMKADVSAISQRLQQQYPSTNSGVDLAFVSMYERAIGNVRPALLVLLGTVGLVLLIACANVANLMLARMASREREISVRTALGASRWRLIRQLMSESILLAVIGGGLGLLMAAWGIDVLPALQPVGIPRLVGIKVNLAVLAFTLGVSLLTGIFFGLIPALTATRTNLSQSLKEGSRGTLGSARGQKFRGALIIAEVGLSVVVLTGAGLLLKSFVRLTEVDGGFVPENLLTANIGLVQFKDPGRRAQVEREIIERVERIPGVEAAGGGTGLPPDIAQRGTRFSVPGTGDTNPLSAYFIAVSPDYFRALGSKLLQGRWFNQEDDSGSPKVVVLSSTLAERLFPDQDAVGKHLRLINPEQSNEPREVVGVVADIRYNGLNDSDVPVIYTPFAQTPFLWNYLMIRTTVSPESVIGAVRDAVQSVDPSLEAANFLTMSQILTRSVAQPRFYVILLGAFAVLALVLATLGIYVVIAYAVSQRTREIGVRMALGARSSSVLGLVIKQGMSLTLIGVILGLAASVAVTRLMRDLLFEVSPTDPVTFTSIAILLALVALVACYLPARRAANVDPMVALRCE